MAVRPESADAIAAAKSIPAIRKTAPPPPDPKKKLIEYLQKHMGVTFTEEEMDTFFEKGDSELFLEEIYKRQKASHCRSSLEKHDL